MWKVLLHCVQNWQNYAAFNYGRLTFWRYQNLSHTNSVQDKRKHHKCEPFLSYSQCSKCLPSLQYNLSTSFSNSGQLCSAENFPTFSPVRLFDSETYLAWDDEAFKKASCIASHTWYLQEVQIWKVRRYVLCAQSPMHLAESAAPSGCSLQQLSKQKLTTIYSTTVCKTLPPKLHTVTS